MFDNLLDLVKEHSGDAIINNPAIPNEKNDEAIRTATTSIVDTLKSQVSGGNLNSVMDLFNGHVDSSAVSSALHSNVASDLMSKLGIDSAQAGHIVSSVLPKVMEQFVKKTNDPDDKSFNITDIVSSLGGSDAGGMLGKITGLFN